MNPRATASHILHAVTERGVNLDTALAQFLPKAPARDHAFIQAMCYGVLRDWPRAPHLLQQLLHKPLKPGSEILRCLLLCGLHELTRMQTAPYAVVSQTVDTTVELGMGWARGLTNAILRSAQRQQDHWQSVLDAQPETRFTHPRWLLERLQQDWPTHWQAIVAANNQQAPMTLRVNQLRISRDDYIYKLQQAGQGASPTRHSHCGVMLDTPLDVMALPGFTQGEVSVQDEAAQLVAPLLNPQPGERILDACAAPGGKTMHLLELQPQLAELVAIDVEAMRLARIRENLQRAGLDAQLICGDATTPEGWWDKRGFDRILLDAPCSATGVIRRHPDIKVLRRDTDIAAVAQQQARLLTALWPLLKPGGMLLYTTCSVLVEENDAQLDTFIRKQTNARIEPLAVAWGQPTTHGRQVLPGEDNMDGFYYACLHKTA